MLLSNHYQLYCYVCKNYIGTFQELSSFCCMERENLFVSHMFQQLLHFLSLLAQFQVLVKLLFFGLWYGFLKMNNFYPSFSSHLITWCFFLKDHFIFILCLWMFCMYVYLCIMWVQCFWMPEGGVVSPWMSYRWLLAGMWTLGI